MDVVAASDESSSRRFLDWLIDAKRITSAVAERIDRVQRETGDGLASIVLKTGLRSEESLAADLVQFTTLNALSPTCMPANPVDIADLNAAFVRAREVVPLRIRNGTLELACWDALDEMAPLALRFSLGHPVERRIGTRTEIRQAIDRLYPESNVSAPNIRDPFGAHEEAEVDRLKDLASDAPVIRQVQEVINDAVTAHASDIHLEPTARGLVVRYRLDGLLKEAVVLPTDLSAPVISRIKVMAGLNIAERRLPQDGRIRVSVQGKEIDFRVSTSPILFGESVVLRILDRDDVALNFDALGFDVATIGVLREAIANPYGILLVTGPTGSGKTTTLYAALKEINTPDKKILTVEDPVEYTLAGVNQVPIRPQIGLTFAHALRSFLRQDPDVMMVGEIRDKETAEIAVQAALTGHLLLSTLHTNSAAAAITRLLDMGIDNFLLTSTLNVILGQRLVRKLCPTCRQAYVPTSAALERFGVSAIEPLTWYRAGACSDCLHTGYRGRTSLVEAFRMSDALRGLVISGADAHALEAQAVLEGMRTMLAHGLQRVAAGETTIEEVLRVTRLDSPQGRWCE